MRIPWPILRVSLAIVAIFALGVVAGRLSEGPPEKPDPPSPTVVEITRAGQRVMARYREELKLTEEQMTTLAPMFARVSQRMAVLLPRSRARLAVLEDFHEEIDPILTKAQRPIANEILEQSRSAERPR